MDNIVKVYIDGACSGNPGPAGAGVYICEPDNSSIKISFFIGRATNNIAEYTALFIALNEVKAYKGLPIVIYSDSELVVRQINGEYKVKDMSLRRLYNKVLDVLAAFSKIEIKHIPREKNKVADALARNAIKISRLVG